jgi:hypothetical protein
MITDYTFNPLTDSVERFESSDFRLFIRNSILYCQYATGLHLSLPVAKSSVELRIFFSKGKSYPVLIDMTGVRSTSADAEQYLSAIGLTLVTANALITESPLKRIAGNLLLSVSKPMIPTRLFTSEARAQVWLSRYVG